MSSASPRSAGPGVPAGKDSRAGALTRYVFVATLAARSEYAPIETRGQIFIWVGALKIAAGSAGTAVAGTPKTLAKPRQIVLPFEQVPDGWDHATPLPAVH